MSIIKIFSSFVRSVPSMIVFIYFLMNINITAQNKMTGGYDYVIKGGLIYDGSLNAPYTADIAISGDKIAAIGNIDLGTAKVIDASGLIVTPGFIDIHEHTDGLLPGMLQLLTKEQLDSVMQFNNYLFQGVTTAVTGNCGDGVTNTEEWLKFISQNNFGVNIAHLIPHGAIRFEVLGKDYQPPELTSEELDKMKSRVREEMEKGAFGLSTGLAYSPGRVATTNEIVELAKIAREYAGYYATHMRDETASIRDDGKISLLESIKETIEIGKLANIPVQISHLKLQAPYNINAQEMFDIIESAQAEGVDITCDSYPFNAGLSEIIILLPLKYKDAYGLNEEYKSGTGLEELKQYVTVILQDVTPDEITIINYDLHPEYVGLTLREIAALEGKSVVDCFVDMAIKNPLPSAKVYAMSKEAMEEILAKPYVATCSDAGGWLTSYPAYHPRYFSAFTKKLKTYAVDRKLISLEFAIRAATQLPAQKLGFTDRGKLSEGYYADIAIFDLNKLDYKSTYENPSVLSEGVEYLFVNGVQTISNGELTGFTGGKALRKTDYTTDVLEEQIPVNFQLNYNYPNPFNPSTKINYTIFHSGNVKIDVFDVLGRNIERLVDEKMEAGKYEVEFDGSHLSSGVYFYKMEVIGAEQSGNFSGIKKMILLK